MKNPDAKAAVHKEWKKLETIPARNLEKVQSNKEVILEAHRDKKKVHFAALMDIGHLVKCGVGATTSEVCKDESCSEVTL